MMHPTQVVSRTASGNCGAETNLRFRVLDGRLADIEDVSSRIVAKHWSRAEREQYPFWIGIFLIALLGIGGMYVKDVLWPALVIALVMLLGLAILVVFYLRTMQGRFDRLWSDMVADGELFRVLRDVGALLGHPVEMGKPDESFSTHIELEFPDTILAVETFLKENALPDPSPSGSASPDKAPHDRTPGLHVTPVTFSNTSGGEAHRIYEVEYRGIASLSLSIRVSRADSGTDVVIGFPLNPSAAETRERLAASLKIRLQDRMLAAKILGDLRASTGMPPVPIPAMESPDIQPERRVSRAI